MLDLIDNIPRLINMLGEKWKRVRTLQYSRAEEATGQQRSAIMNMVELLDIKVGLKMVRTVISA